MKVLGLTGGMGSGKTTVAGFFKELGIPIYIADIEAKKLMETDVDVKQAIVKLLGEMSYSNNSPNRKWIAAQVFNDPEKLQALNKIIHPAVAAHFQHWKQKQQAAYVVYEAAILFEQGGYKQCDYNLLITAPLEEKVSRLQKRDASTPQEIQARMDNQWSDEKKAALADFIIDNTNLSETREHVRNLHINLLESA